MKPKKKRKPMEEKKIIIINVLREKRYLTQETRQGTLEKRHWKKKKIRKVSGNQQSKDSVEEIFKNKLEKIFQERDRQIGRQTLRISKRLKINS